MQIIKSPAPSAGEMPLPSAALVIDVRGVGEDVVETLKVEIKALADEMELQKVHHWRFLTDFLLFKTTPPLNESELNDIRNRQSAKDDSSLSPSNKSHMQGTASQPVASLTGVTHQSSQRDLFPSMYISSGEDISNEDILTTEFYQRTKDFVEVIDHIRNVRINAVGDLGKTGTVGRNTKDPTVRVIFLTDAERPDSLVTAAAYAARLKQYYRNRLEHSGHLPALSTTIICLDHDNQTSAPTRLINNLRWDSDEDDVEADKLSLQEPFDEDDDSQESHHRRWDHIDALILMEKYREDAGRVTSNMQVYVAEVLLYTLLISPPLQVRPPAPDADAHYGMSSDPNKEYISLPPNTYLIGLATIERSMRWGRRLLNYGLAIQIADVLQDKMLVDEQERAKSVANTWFNARQEQIKSALPDQVPGTVLGLKGLNRAESAIQSGSQVLGGSRINPSEHIDQSIQRYADQLAQTYVQPSYKNTSDDEEEISLPLDQPTLRDAIDSLPIIQQNIDRKEDGEVETPLTSAQTEALRVLSHPDFLVSAQGAIPRAQIQLKELSNLVVRFQLAEKKKPIDLEQRKKNVQAIATRGRGKLQSLREEWPQLASRSGMKAIMAWMSVLLLLFLAGIATLTIFAWIYEGASTYAVLGFDSILVPDGASLFNVFTVALVLVLLIATVIIILGLGRSLLDKKRSGFAVEFMCFVLLFSLAAFGLIVPFSLVQFPNHAFLLNGVPHYPFSYVLLSFLLLIGLPLWSTLALILAVAMLMIELVLFLRWREKIEKEGKDIIDALNKEHRENVLAVKLHLANALTIHLMRRAELIDSQGATGAYYKRIEDLERCLNSVREKAVQQQKLAVNRLESTDNVPTLEIRKELLDVKTLMRCYSGLKDSLQSKDEFLHSFAEILLRTMGEESPAQIEEHMRDKSSTGRGKLSIANHEQYQVQTLMDVLTAVAIRCSTPVPLTNPLMALTERFSQLDYRDDSQLPTLKSLLDLLDDKLSKETLNTIKKDKSNYSSRGKDEVTLATQAMASWGQMLWENNVPDLRTILNKESVMMKLEQEGYDPQAIKGILGSRISPSGRAVMIGQTGDLCLFVAPSPQAHNFLLQILPERYIVDFPDTERLLLLHILHYVARPMEVPRIGK